MITDNWDINDFEKKTHSNSWATLVKIANCHRFSGKIEHQQKRGPKYPFLADSFGLVFIFFYHAQNSKSPLQIAGNFKDTGRRLCKEGLKKSPDLESGPKNRTFGLDGLIICSR